MKFHEQRGQAYILHFVSDRCFEKPRGQANIQHFKPDLRFWIKLEIIGSYFVDIRFRGGVMKLWLCLTGLMCLIGCASISVSIDSYNNGQPPKGTCYILPSAKTTTVNDLRFIEFSGYLSRALKSIGYLVVTNPKKANVFVFLDYGVGEPQQQTGTISMPVYGQTGSTSNTYSNGFGGSYTIYQPTYGVVGQSNSTYTYDIYTQWIRLDAYSRKKSKNGEYPQLWKTTIVSAGEQVDLRKSFPDMLGAALPYIATNTGKIVNVESIINRDKNIMYIKGISIQPTPDSSLNSSNGDPN